MKNLFENLMERASTWSDEAQAELVEAMVEIEAKHAGIYHLDEQERLAVRRGLQEVRDGKLATDDMVAEVFGRYRRV